ncbi:MAG: DUF1697 domain-containing protein [Spirochaetaceae bacterium]|nr:MAG: DUF1697 domain-containing protein [Spirochaetaceae bacterium]
MVYVALLRGINVGGKNKLPMPALKATVEKAGMQHVVTYINSGNVVFCCDQKPRAELARTLEAAIEADCGLSVPVLVRSLDEYETMMGHLPPDWTNDQQAKSDVLFLQDEVDTPEVVNELTIKPDVDTVKYVPGALLWTVARSAVTRSGMMRLAGSPLYQRMSIRNVNTTRAIAELMRRVAGE